MRRYSRRSSNSRRFIITIAIIVLLIIVSVIINISLRPIIYDMAEQYGRYALYRAVDDSVSDVFSSNIAYNNIAEFVYNDDGYVSSVNYDYNLVNRIKLSCSKVLTEKLGKLKQSKISVPIGNTVYDINTQGRGIKLRFKFTQSSVPAISIISVFESCGINQTRHEIRLKIDVDGIMYVSPRKIEISCSQEYILSTTIIVGNIPTGYAVIQ